MSPSIAATGCIEIPAERHAAAHAALRSLAPSRGLQPRAAAGDLTSFLVQAGFIVTFDAGAIDGIEFDSARVRIDPLATLRTLAPFIEPGGEIEASGDDDEEWRYLFDGAAMRIEPFPPPAGA